MSPIGDFPLELAELFNKLCEGELDPEQTARLEESLRTDPALCRLYLRYVDLYVDLRRRYSAEQVSDPTPLGQAATDGNEANRTVRGTFPSLAPSDPVFAAIGTPPFCTPDFVPSTTDGTVGYFSSGWPVAYLVATVILGIGLLVGNLVQVSQPVQVVRQSVPGPSSSMQFVGRITGMVDCQWETEGLGIRDWGLEGPRSRLQGSKRIQSLIPNPQSLVALGDTFALSSGLMEISYHTGAKVILQGPATYEVESRTGGYLSMGKLTARVEKGETVRSTEYKVRSEGRGDKADNQKSEIRNQKLFVVRTPTATVTDLGTEFGVEVDTKGYTTSHVFRGSVEVRTMSADETTQPVARILHANESARVENRGNPDGNHREMLFVPSAEPIEFVREVRRRTPKPVDRFDVVADWQFDGDAFLADSSGNGHTLVNHGATQVDGTAAFNGKAIMSTVDSIDLAAYKKIRVSWWQKAISPARNQIVWEQSSNYNNMIGAIIMYLDAEEGHAGIRTGDDRGEYNIDQYPVATDTWEHFSVEYDHAPYRANVVRVFKDGTEIATIAMNDGFAPGPFVNAAFHVGARDGLVSPFVGQIDNLKIEAEAAAPSQ